MGSMIFSTIAMFTPNWVVILAALVCFAIAVVSREGIRALLPTRKKRTKGPKKPEPRQDQTETLYRSGLLTREEYKEKKRNNTRP